LSRVVDELMTWDVFDVPHVPISDLISIFVVCKKYLKFYFINNIYKIHYFFLIYIYI